MKRSWICILALAALAAGGNGFAAPQASSAGEAAKKETAAKPAEQKATQEIYGKIQSIKGTQITLQTRTGSMVQVDAKPAVQAQRSAPLVVGRAIAVKGTLDKAGIFHAEILQRAKDSPSVWPADR